MARASLAVAAAAILLSIPSLASAASPAVTLTITGGGWGHGIGMSQWGARGYANQGRDYRWILAHYYQSTAVASKPTVKVRVNLDANAAARAQWRIQSGAETTLTVEQASDQSRAIALPWAGGTSYWVVTTGTNTAVHADESYYATSTVDGVTTKVLKHRPVATPLMSFAGECYAESNGFVKMVGTSGPFGHSGVVWRGTIHFKPTTAAASASKAVNYVDLEKYLYGVVPRESPSAWPAEALKAQAVAARSYAYGDAEAGRTLYCTTASQVYNGYVGPKGGEMAATNAAVDATKGQVVCFGPAQTVVKTYFCSATGGRTANIEDVWLASSGVPYYTSVPDADTDSPDYKWTMDSLGTDAVSASLRTALGATLSAASPAYVDGMRLDRAESGHTRYATIYWSDGSVYKVPGDRIRTALDLKSTKFTVMTRVESGHGAAKRTASWKRRTAAKSWGGAHYTSKKKGARYTLRFKGTSVKWIGSKHANSGRADVLLDGKKVATVDGYAQSAAYRQVMWASSGLKSGDHTLVIKVRGTKQAASTGTYVRVDAFELKGTPVR